MKAHGEGCRDNLALQALQAVQCIGCSRLAPMAIKRRNAAIAAVSGAFLSDSAACLECAGKTAANLQQQVWYMSLGDPTRPFCKSKLCILHVLPAGFAGRLSV